MPTEVVVAIVLVVVLYVVMRLGRNRKVMMDWEAWRLFRKRPHWQKRSPGDRGRSFDSTSYSIQIDGMDPERNRRLNELIAERDAVACAALLEAEGYEGAEAIDMAERYTGREHPEAETRGYPAQYAKKGPSGRSAGGSSGGGWFGGPRRIGFEKSGGGDTRTRAEIARKVEQRAGEKPSGIEFDTALHALIEQNKKLEAIKLYREHHGTDLRTAKGAVERYSEAIKLSRR